MATEDKMVYKFELNGVEYGSLKSACKDFNVCYFTALRKRKKGMSYEDILLGHIKVGDKRFFSTKDFVEYYNLNPGAVYAKLYRGQTYEQILYGKNFIRVNGLIFKNVTAFCDFYKIDSRRVNRWRKEGLSYEEILTRFFKGKYIVFGKGYNNLKDIAKDHKIEYYKLIYLNRTTNKTAEEIVRILLDTKNSKK